MTTLGLKEIQTNPALLGKSIETEPYALITKRGKPLGLFMRFDSTVINQNLKNALALNAYENGDLSLGQLAEALNLSKTKAIDLLGELKIPLFNYDLSDEFPELKKPA